MSSFILLLIDILASILSLLLLSSVLVFIMIQLKREEPRCPVFYRLLRAGRGGKIFGILKFRTMYERPESYYQGSCITAKDDERITPLGHWIRDTKFNDIRQLWNVLKGEMSLVGPRPEDPEIIKTWLAVARREILSVRPGINSPGLVLSRNEEKLLNNGIVMNEYSHKILPGSILEASDDAILLMRLKNRHLFELNQAACDILVRPDNAPLHRSRLMQHRFIKFTNQKPVTTPHA
jgi:lipopolysaccharide/colanic/teichoic acid biosynthesis glycosyltransferase